jgi:hypothetical protein
MFQKNVVEKIKIHLLFSVFLKLYRLLENVEKYCRAGQDTDDNMMYVH